MLPFPSPTTTAFWKQRSVVVWLVFDDVKLSCSPTVKSPEGISDVGCNDVAPDYWIVDWLLQSVFLGKINWFVFYYVWNAMVSWILFLEHHHIPLVPYHSLSTTDLKFKRNHTSSRIRITWHLAIQRCLQATLLDCSWHPYHLVFFKTRGNSNLLFIGAQIGHC